MFRKILQIIVVCVLLGYMLFAISFMNPKIGGKTNCKEVKISFVKANEREYYSEEEILKKLEKAELSPEGKILDQINTAEYEEFLSKDPLIKKVECYKTTGSKLMIKIYQRTPILRVMTSSEDYYVDQEGQKMPVPRNFATYVPFATGYIDDDFAQNELLQFVAFLNDNKYWNNEIQQIYVHRNKDIELTPRTGNHQILLGKVADCSENLDKLLLFYEKGLDKIGWNRYSVVNLKFKDRVICTKK